MFKKVLFSQIPFYILLETLRWHWYLFYHPLTWKQFSFHSCFLLCSSDWEIPTATALSWLCLLMSTEHGLSHQSCCEHIVLLPSDLSLSFKSRPSGIFFCLFHWHTSLQFVNLEFSYIVPWYTLSMISTKFLRLHSGKARFLASGWLFVLLRSAEPTL